MLVYMDAISVVTVKATAVTGCVGGTVDSKDDCLVSVFSAGSCPICILSLALASEAEAGSIGTYFGVQAFPLQSSMR